MAGVGVSISIFVFASALPYISIGIKASFLPPSRFQNVGSIGVACIAVSANVLHLQNLQKTKYPKTYIYENMFYFGHERLLIHIA